MSHKRIRTLTTKGMALYEDKVEELKKRTFRLWSQVTQTLNRSSEVTSDLSIRELDSILSEVTDRYEEYRDHSRTFEKFLENTNTKSSIEELEVLLLEQAVRQTEFDKFIELIEITKKKILEQVMASIKSNKSVKSLKTLTSKSRKSVSSELIALKMAEAEAAKVKVQFAEKEAVLLKLKAEVEEKEKIATAAIARQKATLEADLNILNQHKVAAAAAAEVKVLEERSEGSVLSDSDLNDLRHIPVTEPKRLVEDYLEGILLPEHSEKIVKQPEITVKAKVDTVGDDLCKFLLKKDLALSRLSTFNDKPETYQSWKTSFKQVMKEMDVSPSEEMDLLVKWLGVTSKTHAISIRSAFRKDPQKARQKVWERLDERYGTVESIHHSITKKLESFPKLSNKDTGKWYELVDLLAEIEALKQDGDYAAALSFFDSSIGLAPVLSKLPFNTQERWASKANTYKKQNDVAFPPFSVFLEFICDQAKIRNDPSLQPVVVDNAPKKDSENKKTVFSKKTEVPPKTKSADDNLCPIHKAKHVLSECHAFKKKSSDDKRQFLKENRICYKCANSTKHKAKECQASVKCDVCGSSSHIGVMHINKKPQEDNGGEAQQEKECVNSRCTEIDQDFKSCAKIVLVNVFSESNPQCCI